MSIRRQWLLQLMYLLLVVEPGKRSIETAKNIKSLAGDIGIKRLLL